eukprot:4488900-Pyramimonas_sp.AAC.1
MELDTAADHEEEHIDDVEGGSDKEEESAEATGQAIIAAFQIDPQTRPCAPDDGAPFGKYYFLIEDTLPLPKHKQISEEDLMTLWAPQEGPDRLTQIGLELEGLTPTKDCSTRANAFPCWHSPDTGGRTLRH